MKLGFIVILLFNVIVCFADDIAPPPAQVKSTKVAMAFKAYEAEIKRLKELQDKAIENYRATLKQAQAEAMKAGNTEEYEALKAYISGETPAEVAEKEDKKPNSVEVLEDRHPGNAGVPDSTTGNEYNLILRAKPQKAILVIEHKKYDDKRISVGSITLNGAKIGAWDLGTRTDKEAETMEIDISKYLTRSYAKYKVAFNYKTGGDSFVTYCVKVVYK